MPHVNIIKAAENFISDLFSEKLSPNMIYHNYAHTLDVVNNSIKIGTKSGLNDSELEIVTLAAWFHDSGYTVTYNGHEDAGKEIAAKFLNEHNYDPGKINLVLGCINSTKMPQAPQNLMEQVICDADLIHFGQEDFFEYSELLKTEWETLGINHVSEADWYKASVDLLSTHRFFTQYARRKFSQQQSINLLKAQKNYRKLLQQANDEAGKKAKLEFEKEKLEIERQKIASRKDEEKLAVEKEKIAFKKESAKVAERGIETMFRNTVRTHVEFSAMADSKANIMITVNTLIISLILTNLFSEMQEDSQFFLLIPTVMLLTVCLSCIIFGILVTKPKISTGVFSQEDIKSRKTNLLFFGNFFNMPLDDFQWGMDEMMHDKDYLYSSMVKDFYFLGQAVGRKFKYLRVCYSIFMYGLVASVLAYIIAILLNYSSTPPA
ncbi:MAG: HD domain-containing protein [Ignavibacteria bacterium]|nr:HD domain-containing protein [Ignavibacteria bacterium]